MEKQTADILLETKAVTVRVDPPFKWVSGIIAPIYTDNRILMSFPKERQKIIDYFITIIKENNLNPDVIAGIATSGIPWAAWVADRLDLPMVYIRKKSKEHGKQNLIEGKLEKGQNVVIIEDLISTGGSSINGVQAVKEAGGKVLANLAIFTYELKESIISFQAEKVNLITLTNFSTLLERATEKEYINQEEKDYALEWASNPNRWGK